MGICCETMLCKRIKVIVKANDLTAIELNFLNQRSLNFKDKKMHDGFQEYRRSTLMYWALYITMWGTIH